MITASDVARKLCTSSPRALESSFHVPIHPKPETSSWIRRAVRSTTFHTQFVRLKCHISPFKKQRLWLLRIIYEVLSLAFEAIYNLAPVNLTNVLLNTMESRIVQPPLCLELSPSGRSAHHFRYHLQISVENPFCSDSLSQRIWDQSIN